MGFLRQILRALCRLYTSFKYRNCKIWRKQYALRHIKGVTGKLYKKTLKGEFHTFFYASEIKHRNFFRTRFDYWLCWILLGAIPRDYFAYCFFDMPWHDRVKHVTQTELTFVNDWLNNPAQKELLDNKAKFNAHYADFIKRKWCDPATLSKGAFIALFADTDAIVVKTQTGLGGHDVHVFRGTDLSELYDSLAASPMQLVVETLVKQQGMLHDFNPSSVNTIRMTTVRIGNDVRLLHAYLRIGRSGSVTDNVSSGGMGFLINRMDGSIQQGFSFSSFNLVSHPDSGIRITGNIIPKWNMLIDFVTKAHLFAPEGLHLIGWDVCLSDDGISLIEGNSGPGFPPIANPDENHWAELADCMDAVFPE